MDFLQKIGGRKFWMALLATGVATYVELHSANGLSTTMAAFLGGIVAAFSAANYAATAKHMDTKTGGGRGDGDVSEKIDRLLDVTLQANSPENMNALTQLLSNITNGISELQKVSGQIGTGVLNIGTEVQKISKRG